MAVKLAKKKEPKESTGKLITAGFLEYICAFWAIVLAVAVPLYMKEGYYQIGTAKYNAYAHVVVFGMPILLLLVLLYVIFGVKENGISLSGIKGLWKGMSVTDRFVLAYFLSVLVSYLLCGHWKEAFWGYNGWFMGLFSQLSFVLIYFICSRFLKDSPLVLVVLCIVSSYVFLLGVQHRLLIDPIGVYDNINDYYKTQFLSTLGQASWYSGFMTTVLPIGMLAFWYFRNIVLKVVSGLFLLLSFMTMVTQNTDSAYFGFLAATLVLLHVSVKDAKRMRCFFEVMLLFSIAPKCMQFLLKMYPNQIMKWDTISNFLIFDNRLWIAVAFFAIMIVACLVLDKKEIYPQKAIKIIRNTVYIMVILFLVFWIAVLWLGAKGWLPEGIANLTAQIPYFVWHDGWGNGRGFTWSVTWQMLSEMDLKHLLFGVGPDCYAIYAHGNYNELLKVKWGDMILTNAHNEWLNMFFNGGLLGGTLYLGIFISALVRFIKKCGERPLLLGMAACVAAYVAHNIFCYQEVLCTPFVFLFLAIGEYQIRKKES